MKTKEFKVLILLGLLTPIFSFHSQNLSNSKVDTFNKSSESISVTESSNSNFALYRYVIAKSGLKLRQGTDTKSKVLTTIPFKTKVEVIGEEKGEEVTKGASSTWYQIKYKGLEGFAYGEFLSDLPNLLEIPDSLTGEYLETTPLDSSCRTDMSSSLFIRKGIVICVFGETGQILSTCIPEKIVEDGSKLKMDCSKNPNENMVKKLLGSPIAGATFEYLPVPKEFTLEIKSKSLLKASCHADGPVDFLRKVEYLKLPICKNFNDSIQ